MQSRDAHPTAGARHAASPTHAPVTSRQAASHLATALGVSNVSHRYGDREALRSISFDVQPGEIFGLLGPNGGGKTTLFRIVTTLLPPTSGQVHVFGHDVTQEAARVRRDLGVVFQAPALDVRLRVAENLKHHGHLYGLQGRVLAARVDEVLALVGLQDRARDLVGTLSGGLQRRAELAKALLPQPKLLVLDEPGTGLDPGAGATCGITSSSCALNVRRPWWSRRTSWRKRAAATASPFFMKAAWWPTVRRTS